MRGLLAVTVTFLLIFSVPAAANGSHAPELPGPGTTPDSALYGLDRAFEGLSLALSMSPEARADKHIRLAEERLSEARAMAERGRTDLARRAITDYGQGVDAAVRQAGETAEDSGSAEHVAEATTNHISVLDRVEEEVPEEAKGAIADARSRSIRGNKEALRALAGRDAEDAARRAMLVATSRAEKARHKAEENETEEAEAAVREFSEYAGFGQEVADIAQNAGQNATAVQEIVAQATSHHITVLQDVLEMVPEEAKEGIRTALDNAERGRQQAVEALPETMPVPGQQTEETEVMENETTSSQQTGGETAASAVERAPDAAPDRTVDLTDYEFSDTSISATDGEVIEFDNTEGRHTVTLDSEGIDAVLSEGESTILRFKEEGTYQLYCRFHGSPGSGMYTEVSVNGGTSGNGGGGY